MLNSARKTMPTQPLSTTLPGTWELLSRVDVTASGERLEELSLGSDPIDWWSSTVGATLQLSS